MAAQANAIPPQHFGKTCRVKICNGEPGACPNAPRPRWAEKAEELKRQRAQRKYQENYRQRQLAKSAPINIVSTVHSGDEDRPSVTFSSANVLAAYKSWCTILKNWHSLDDLISLRSDLNRCMKSFRNCKTYYPDKWLELVESLRRQIEKKKIKVTQKPPSSESDCDSIFESPSQRHVFVPHIGQQNYTHHSLNQSPKEGMTRLPSEVRKFPSRQFFQKNRLNRTEMGIPALHHPASNLAIRSQSGPFSTSVTNGQQTSNVKRNPREWPPLNYDTGYETCTKIIVSNCESPDRRS